MSKISIEYSESVSGGEICEGQEDDSWPNYEDEIHSVSIGDLVLSKEPRLNGEEVPFSGFNPEDYIGKHLYVVYVRYTTGGTFGSSLGNPCFPACFTSPEEAEKVVDAINKGTWGEGEYVPWVGYFERLESVEMICKKLIDKRK